MFTNLSNHSRALQEDRRRFEAAIGLWKQLPKGPDLKPSEILEAIACCRSILAVYRQEFRRMLAGEHEGQREMFGDLETAARSHDRDLTVKVAGCLLRTFDRCAETFADDDLVQSHYGLAGAILYLHYYLAFRPHAWPTKE